MRLLFLSIVFMGYTSYAQNGFPFGKISVNDLEMISYDRDASAEAVVLKEFAETFINYDESGALILDHHLVIKILKQSGVERANQTISLYKVNGKGDRLLSLNASSYNLENGVIQESKMSSKNIFTENQSKYYDVKKYTIPNVRLGSIIEIQYRVEKPYYLYNFQPWVFQSDIPKVSSEYWATIPGHLTYNITWKGFLKFKKNEGEVFKNCYMFGNNVDKSDCARYKFMIENVPAFIREDYMTAESNFISSINFELAEMADPTGGVNKVTKEWKDVDSELLKENLFGGQLKKGKDINQKLSPEIIAETDPLQKAKKIYEFIKNWFTWDEYYGLYSEGGIKKAFESKTGNVADINLSLIASMRQAGLDVEPLVLSTRNNGTPTELHPVLTDFNYVVAKLNITDKVYLLDATDPLLPFGFLPERCLNGKGRVFADKKPSYWYDIKPTDVSKGVTVLDLTLQPSGKFTGIITIKHSGYRAYNKRKEIRSHATAEEYVKDIEKKSSGMTITGHSFSGIDTLENPLIERYVVTLEGFDNLTNENMLLSPFFLGKMERNPFRSTERLYPVDFGLAQENSMVLNLTYPTEFELVSKPEKSALTISGGAAKFLFDINDLGNRLVMNYTVSINKPVFHSSEYQNLKEFYSRIIQTQQSELIFKKK